jgi:hypothetical protein
MANGLPATLMGVPATFVLVEIGVTVSDSWLTT